jgi:hypothetical protein
MHILFSVWLGSNAARLLCMHTKTHAQQLAGPVLLHQQVSSTAGNCCCCCCSWRLCCSWFVSECVVGSGSECSVAVFLMFRVVCSGIMKVNLAGPGLTETVKTLWRKPATA